MCFLAIQCRAEVSEIKRSHVTVGILQARNQSKPT